MALEYPAALIFDCDGVLVDSEIVAQRIERAHLASIGLHYDEVEFVHRFTGTSEPEFFQRVQEDARERLRCEIPDGIIPAMKRAVEAEIARALQPIAGADAMVARWRGLKAVASSSSETALRFKLTRTGLDAAFGAHVYSAELVGRGKPDPAVFLHAASRLEVEPSGCAAIEDSVNGIVAAKRAGMTAIGFVGGAHCVSGHADALRERGADAVFRSFSQLGEYLGLN
ncbi:MAG: HAD-IA family hydrolase [Pseudomonadales bacterium]|nr:HAD family phosphatase [Pseudomonadales bacterium]NIX07898.1 HAD-IA family hydrolase [Pseudomonadales bacterium]